jgi:two-component system chemotaxis response regulator CheB
MSGSGHRAFDVIAFVGSQGGLQALSEVLAALPQDFPAAIVVALHRAPTARDHHKAILEQRSGLPVELVSAEQPLRRGVIHIGNSASELVVSNGRVVAKPRGLRPRSSSGDRLLASVAAAYRERAVGVVLSGRLRDGAQGAVAIKSAGGRVLVQSAASCRCAAMPEATLASGSVDFALEPAGLAAAVTSLVMVQGAAELFRVRAPSGMSLEG